MVDTPQHNRARRPVKAGEAGEHWEPLWQSGRRYRSMDTPEREALNRQVGIGRGRPALDIGSGDGALVQALAELGYRPTGIDCAPSARRRGREGGPHRMADLPGQPLVGRVRHEAGHVQGGRPTGARRPGPP
ncbi:class I SAM-dependent methyltransferase [Streptomyces sp. NPDC050388]|uniref:class I SAM-dependent methyltransferase n=1 Tax=Streptomyces sp. NPDC050388 TaxID=3155781 RepID=UPI003426A00D